MSILVCLSFIHVVCYLYWSGYWKKVLSMQHRRGPTARSWTSVLPGKGGKGVGGGTPVEKRKEKHEYEGKPPVNEMNLPSTLLQSEHENTRVMSDAISAIQAQGDTRAMSDTRDVMLTYETMPTMPVNTNETSPENTHEPI